MKIKEKTELVKGLGSTINMIERDGIKIGDRYFISKENLSFKNTLEGFKSVRSRFYETTKEEWDRYFDKLNPFRNGIEALMIGFGFKKIIPPAIKPK